MRKYIFNSFRELTLIFSKNNRIDSESLFSILIFYLTKNESSINYYQISRVNSIWSSFEIIDRKFNRNLTMISWGHERNQAH